MSEQQHDSGSLSAPNQAPSNHDPFNNEFVNGLKKELTDAQRRNSGLQGVFQKTQSELNELKAQFETLNQELEGSRAMSQSVEQRLQQQQAQWQTQIDELQKKLAERETAFAKAERERTIQQHLLSDKYAPLIPLYEKKTLRPFNDEGKPLEGDELVAFLDSALDTVGDAGRYRQVQQQEQQQRDSFGSRSAPSQVVPATEDVTKLGQDLTNGTYRYNTPEYDAAMARYQMLLANTRIDSGDFLR